MLTASIGIAKNVVTTNMKLFNILVVKLPSWLKDFGDHILIGRTTSPVCQAKISLNEIYLEL